MIWTMIKYDQDDCGGSPCAGAFDHLQPRLPLLHHRRDAFLVAHHQSHWMWAGSGWMSHIITTVITVMLTPNYRHTTPSETLTPSLCTQWRESLKFAVPQGQPYDHDHYYNQGSFSHTFFFSQINLIITLPPFSDSVIFLYLGVAMVNFQMYQWDAGFIGVSFFLCLFVR